MEHTGSASDRARVADLGRHLEKLPVSSGSDEREAPASLAWYQSGELVSTRERHRAVDGATHTRVVAHDHFDGSEANSGNRSRGDSSFDNNREATGLKASRRLGRSLKRSPRRCEGDHEDGDLGERAPETLMVALAGILAVQPIRTSPERPRRRSGVRMRWAGWSA